MENYNILYHPVYENITARRRAVRQRRVARKRAKKEEEERWVETRYGDIADFGDGWLVGSGRARNMMVEQVDDAYFSDLEVEDEDIIEEVLLNHDVKEQAIERYEEMDWDEEIKLEALNARLYVKELDWDEQMLLLFNLQ